MQPGMFTAFFQKPGEPLRIRHLLSDPVDPSSRLATVALMCERRQETILLPPDDLVLKPGDHLLCMSNGGFGGIHGKLLDALQARN